MAVDGNWFRACARSGVHSSPWLAVALLAVVWPTRVQAGSPADRAAAEALFQEGRQYIARGELEPGCRKLAESQRRDPAIGTLLNLGDCYDRLGRSASAWTQFRAASKMARAVGDAPRAGEADRRAAVLEPKLHRLRIVVPASQPKGLVVTRDGVVVGVPVYGSALPVDPGEHSIEASAPGMQKWITTIRCNGSGRALEVSIPQLKPERRESSEGGWPAQRWVALAVGGAGVVGVGVGTAYWLRSSSTWKEAQARCPGNTCPDARDVSLEQDARREASVATVGVSLGIAALGVGGALWLTAPAAETPGSTVAARGTLQLRPWGTGLMLGGVY